MNWSRGLLRGWVVLSALWVAGTAWAFHADPAFYAEPIWASHDDIFVRVEVPPVATKKDVVDLVASAIAQVRFGNAANNSQVSASQPTPDQFTADVLAADRAADSYSEKRPWWRLSQATLIALALPTALLISGAVGAWVARGFQPT